MRKLRKIGPYLQTMSPFTMQKAIETDIETGSHHFNNAESKKLFDRYPTIMAMAMTIERERDRLLVQVAKLKQQQKKGKYESRTVKRKRHLH